MTSVKIIALENAAASGWPALKSEVQGGWLWRFAAGYSKRANSVLPLSLPADEDLEHRIEAVEAGYRRAGLIPTVKLPEHPDWRLLDETLEARGWAWVDPSLVMTRSLPLSANSPAEEFTAKGDFGKDWFEAFLSANNVEPGFQPTARKMAAKVEYPVVGTVNLSQGAVAWGYAALVDDQAWLFDIVVHPKMRRQGLGRVLVTGLLDESARRGARIACLQVLASNHIARALYTSLGFEEAYRYGYRRLL